jgi:hypothetical protein
MDSATVALVRTLQCCLDLPTRLWTTKGNMCCSGPPKATCVAGCMTGLVTLLALSTGTQAVLDTSFWISEALLKALNLSWVCCYCWSCCYHCFSEFSQKKKVLILELLQVVSPYMTKETCNSGNCISMSISLNTNDQNLHGKSKEITSGTEGATETCMTGSSVLFVTTLTSW